MRLLNFALSVIRINYLMFRKFLLVQSRKVIEECLILTMEVLINANRRGSVIINYNQNIKVGIRSGVRN